MEETIAYLNPPPDYSIPELRAMAVVYADKNLALQLQKGIKILLGATHTIALQAGAPD